MFTIDSWLYERYTSHYMNNTKNKGVYTDIYNNYKYQEIIDLRTALAALQEIEGQLLETDTEVDPFGELCGV